MGISRDSKYQKRATGGKRNAWRKKHKFELGRQPANTKLSRNKVVRRVRVGGGNLKWSSIVPIDVTAEELQGGNKLMDVEDEQEESSGIQEDQVFDGCPRPKFLMDHLIWKAMGENWEHLAQNDSKTFRAAAAGSQESPLDAHLFVLKEILEQHLLRCQSILWIWGYPCDQVSKVLSLSCSPNDSEACDYWEENDIGLAIVNFLL
ncbi:hypothetical protein K7X08_010589 [Anisodus acutangulus]|uniref:40S ribosomal protein S8 n=1 Tax=Anisodus acutangulus TaxID=402998 RepID=A0A9Q1L2K0_9SOLA|nr:hypothetical protein K7X08_010589 [Anisodus acutangulus]